VLNIHEKGYRNHPLTDAQKASNKEKLEDFDTWYYKESPAYLYEIYKSEVSL
jgi:hypothetical protein